MQKMNCHDWAILHLFIFIIDLFFLVFILPVISTRESPKNSFHWRVFFMTKAFSLKISVGLAFHLNSRYGFEIP